MNNEKSEITMAKSMQYIGLTQMPEPAKKGQDWAYAILHVAKSDGLDYYVVQGIDKSGNHCIKADFESTHSIIGVLGVYPVFPYDLRIDMIPLDMCNRKDIINWMVLTGTPITPPVEEMKKMKDKELYDLCVRCLRIMNYNEIKEKYQ